MSVSLLISETLEYILMFNHIALLSQNFLAIILLSMTLSYLEIASFHI